MLLEINGVIHEVEHQAVIGILTFIEALSKEMYDKLPVHMQIMADQGARAMLYDLEKKMVSKGYTKEQAKEMRPEKGTAPTQKIASVALGNAVPFLNKITVVINKTEQTVKSIGIKIDEEL